MLDHKWNKETMTQIHIFYIMLVTTEREKLVCPHGQKNGITHPTNVSLVQLYQHEHAL